MSVKHHPNMWRRPGSNWQPEFQTCFVFLELSFSGNSSFCGFAKHTDVVIWKIPEKQNIIKWTREQLVPPRYQLRLYFLTVYLMEF